MATLLLSAVGTALGGPLGGAIGALAGRAIDGAVLGGGRGEGPRLKELAPTTSTYGQVLPRHFGRMRVAGAIIWATDLVEHRESQGGGKGRPSVTSYTYTASFAVALGSRPIAAIGRIWADGNLLRGEGGDLKVGGAMRLHHGWGDQAPDPLIAAAEGLARCPAWRGSAYVVFEDLELGDFFNRIPALTFEVIADPGAFTLQDVVDPQLAEAAVALPGIAGLTCEGPVADVLRQLDPVLPIACDAGGERLVIARERLQDAPIVLPEAAVAVEDDAFGGLSGRTRRREALPQAAPEILRYYDLDRDYQPGVQRATGRMASGQPWTVELPMAMAATDARALAETVARRAGWRRETLSWRCAALDPAVAPGALVTVPGLGGRWRVAEWEWRASGVELTLERAVPTGADAVPAAPVDPGRINPPPDLPPPPTTLAAFELPWDGTGNGDAPTIYAAASAETANWRGAALYVDRGDGALEPLGPSGRTRGLIGEAETALAPAHPLLFDRGAGVVIRLVDPAMDLIDASGRQLALGANRALLGDEIIQFGRAEPLGAGRWRLRLLLRGCGGTEAALANHVAGERFVLLDGRPVALDPARVGSVPGVQIAAVGFGDDAPVLAPIALRGVGLRPPAPVHPRVAAAPDGALELGWTRRARGGWAWRDGVDVPLQEQVERYIVTLGDPAAPAAVWEPSEPRLALSAATLAALPTGALRVRQQGSHALSEPLFLTTLA
ncbi:phage tail protein [Novosphingobium sp. JCM 18896]|uniref:phage tail protein n=1 Tax=Novosphingobium sp. JCM 18896 TaxID=2989731 RepID=UPI002222653E|nr:phage tail protein [Novosphingobium sp. JCM 18896]MCW1429146.1 phage tail protein [Novosphingobium sp. JCM 18896]